MRGRIAIIGGGPAGSAFTLYALRAGIDPADLVLVDKARFPRPKLCGGGITFRGTELFEDLVGRPPGGSHTLGLRFDSRRHGSFPVRERGPQWLYDRGLLDHALLEKVREAGVEVREGCRITGLSPLPSGGFRLEWKGGNERFRWVVGADGARGVVRRAAGLAGGIVGRLVEAVYAPVDGEADPHTLIFDFDPILDGIPGYAWIFPYPKPDGTEGVYKLGIMDGRGRAKGRALREWTEAYAARHGFRRLDPKIAGWPEHYFARRTRAHRPGLILVGEAWGIDPLLGEGIAPALETARYAARRLKEALDAGRSTIPGYERRFLFTEAGANLWFQAQLADRLYGPRPEKWLRVMFESRYMRTLAASGEHRYGRLSGRGPAMFLSYLWGKLLGRERPALSEAAE